MAIRLNQWIGAFDASMLRDAVLDAAAVLAPTECSGCGAVDRALCSSCVAALRADVTVVQVGRSPPRGAPGVADVAGPLSVPAPLSVYCALRYAGVARRVLLAVKETGRTDAAPALAHALMSAMAAALAAATDCDKACDSIRGSPRGGVEIATIPSTRAAYRARGYHPTELVLAHAGLRSTAPLRAARQTADQAALSSTDRLANRLGSLVAARRLERRCFILVDDIVTTGATLREATRAIEQAGGSVLSAVAIANTPLLRPGR